MKIVHLCLNFDYHKGYSYQDNLLAKYHHKMGNNVTVISSDLYNKNDDRYFRLKHGEYFEENGVVVKAIDVKRTPFVFINKILRRYEGLYNILNFESPDILFVHGLAYWDIHVVARFLKTNPSVICYCDNHGDYYNSVHGLISKYIFYGILWRHGVRSIMPYVRKFYGVTPWRCSFLKEMYGVDDCLIEYLPLGVDDECIPTNRTDTRNAVLKFLQIPSDSFIISTGGKIDKSKNIHNLLCAVKELGNEKVHVIVYGKIDAETQKIIDGLHLSDQFTFVGWSNAEQIMNYIVSSDLCCFPGTHSTLWEQSVGAGVPCVFNDWGAEMHHLNICDNAKFVDGDDVTSIEEVISSLVFTREYYLMRENAITASRHFLYSQIAKTSIEHL